jgi:hypothetical protein
VYQNFISYLYETQHVSGDTPPIIGRLKLHWPPLVLRTWKVVGRVGAGCCQVEYVSGSWFRASAMTTMNKTQPEAQ